LDRLAADDQHRHPVDVRQLTLAVLGVGEGRPRIGGGSQPGERRHQERRDESRHAHSSYAAVVRPRATSNSLNSGTSMAATANPKAAARARNGTSGSADSSVPGLAIRMLVTQ